MVIAWLRSLLIFDGFLAPDSTSTVPTSEPAGESWMHQLLVLDGFIEAEREVQSTTQVPVELRFPRVSTVSLPAVPSTNSEPETAAMLASPESFEEPEMASSIEEAETCAPSEKALTDWQRILGWKE